MLLVHYKTKSATGFAAMRRACLDLSHAVNSVIANKVAYTACGLHTFWCCRLDVHPGQLPSAFEGDERAHPSLTADLLHLVHGRALLGVVRIKQQLLLEGT